MPKTTLQRIQEALCRCSDGSEVSDADVAELDSELAELLLLIAEKESPQDAAEELRELGALQSFMALLAFKYDVELTDRQRKVVRDYDRWDDEETRVWFFREIAEGRV